MSVTGQTIQAFQAMAAALNNEVNVRLECIGLPMVAHIPGIGATKTAAASAWTDYATGASYAFRNSIVSSIQSLSADPTPSASSACANSNCFVRGVGSREKADWAWLVASTGYVAGDRLQVAPSQWDALLAMIDLLTTAYAEDTVGSGPHTVRDGTLQTTPEDAWTSAVADTPASTSGLPPSWSTNHTGSGFQSTIRNATEYAGSAADLSGTLQRTEIVYNKTSFDTLQFAVSAEIVAGASTIFEAIQQDEIVDTFNTVSGWPTLGSAWTFEADITESEAVNPFDSIPSDTLTYAHIKPLGVKIWYSPPAL